MKNIVPLNPAQQPRRPEVARLAVQLKRQHPDWSERHCITQAKLIVTSKTTETRA